MRTRIIITTVVAALAFSTVAFAQKLQKPRPRQGYFTTFGMHGLAARHDDSGDTIKAYGFSNNLHLGQMLTATLGLGLALDLGSGEAGDDASMLIGVGIEGQWEVATNLAARAGVGLGVVSVDDLSQDDEDLRGVYGAAYTVGISYDWFFTCPRQTGGWALTPVAQLRWLPGGSFDSWSGILGVEISRWTGLPKNQLELSNSEAFR